MRPIMGWEQSSFGTWKIKYIGFITKLNHILIALLTYHSLMMKDYTENLTLHVELFEISQTLRLRRDWKTEVTGKGPYLPMFTASED